MEQVPNDLIPSHFNLDKSANYKLINTDCFNVLSKLKADSIDLILTDLPYGVSKNKWDTPLNLETLWKEWKRILKPRGAVVLTSAQPFTSRLTLSNPDWFKYDLVWKKTVCSGQLNVKRMPLRAHESLLIFYNKPPVYNEQLTEGKAYTIKRKKSNATNQEGESGYGKQSGSKKVNTGFRHATSVIEVSNPRIKGEHPNCKPVELMKWIIRTYTNEGNTVLDNCMGTGNTGVAAIELHRKFIGIEIDKKYFDKANSKIKGVKREKDSLTNKD